MDGSSADAEIAGSLGSALIVRRGVRPDLHAPLYNHTGPLRGPKEATMVELEIYAMGEPTGAEIKVDPAFVAGVEELPGKPRASVGQRGRQRCGTADNGHAGCQIDET